MQLDQRPTPPAETFVVRIYRRDVRGAGRIAGTVEIIAGGTERSFTGMRELQQILGTKAGTRAPLPISAKPEKGGPS